MKNKLIWILGGGSVFSLIVVGNLMFNLNLRHFLEVRREQAIFSNFVTMPITFYGKAVDEKGNPIAGAEVKISAADHPYADGSKYECTSDENGLFSITGIYGAALSVTISKDGYYSVPESWGSFANVRMTPQEKPAHLDPSDPAILVLRKRGETEPLVSHVISSEISRAGAPVSIDLHSGRTYRIYNPDVQVQSWVDDEDIKRGTSGHYDWRCKVTVPGGGLQIRQGDQFDFTAPESGYQPDDEIEVHANDPNWKDNWKREYYLKLADGQYGRIEIVFGAGSYNSFEITSYLNPANGHRNLESNSEQTASQ